MNKKFIILSLVFLVAAPLARAESVFNPNYIISDYDVTNSRTMTQLEIQRFLESKNSYLANYFCTDNVGRSLRASEAIYNVATTNLVNPRFILVLLQKEQSLVESATAPTPRQLDWATGYGCPDGAACNVRWQGFWKQINSASLQFRDYLDNPDLYTYKKNQSYTFTNPYSSTKKEINVVMPVNNATAALYNYTPHVYNGNYNFWKIWNRWFTNQGGYPSGTLVRGVGENGIWMIENGLKRPFLTKGAFASRFDINKVLTVKKEDLARYETGLPIKFPQYSIVRSPDAKLYLLVDNKKRVFASTEAFKKIGYNPEEVLNATWDDVNSYIDGATITAEEAYPTGALMQDKKTGGVFWISEGAKAPIIDPIILKTRFKNKKPLVTSSDKLAKYPLAAPVMFNDGELVKIDKGLSYYVVEGKTLRPIKSKETFDALGYSVTNVITIPVKVFQLYQAGEMIN